MHPVGGSAAAASPHGARTGAVDRAAGDRYPLIEPAPGGPLARAGAWLDHHPAAVLAALTVAGFLVLASLAIAVGLLLVDVLLPAGLRSPDEHANTWLAARRDGTLDDASYVGSMIGDIPFLPVVVAAVVLVAAFRRRFLVAGYVLAAIVVEVATYRVASLVVHRERPEVPRLDRLPVDQSYPSGHVAASVAVYVGIALLLTSRWREGAARLAVWAVAILLPIVVAASRMYRGMHHPADVTAGALVGLGSIAVAVVAARAASEAARRREAAR